MKKVIIILLFAFIKSVSCISQDFFVKISENYTYIHEKENLKSNTLKKVRKGKSVQAIDFKANSNLRIGNDAVKIRYKNNEGWIIASAITKDANFNKFMEYIYESKYNIIKNSYSTIAFKNYLISFPYSKFRMEAQTKYCELAYQETLNKGTKEGYNWFIKNNCNSKYDYCYDSDYCEKARQELISIKEREEFRDAIQSNSDDKMIEFILGHPRSTFIDEIAVKLQNYTFEKLEADLMITREELNEVITKEILTSNNGEQFDFGFDTSKIPHSFGSRESSLIIGKKVYFKLGAVIDFHWTYFRSNSKLIFLYGEGVVEKKGLLMLTGTSIIKEK